MPDEAKNPNPEQQDDLLEKLLAGAAEKAAKQQVEELASKGVVTRADFNTALSQFKDEIVAAVAQKAAPVLPAGVSVLDEDEESESDKTVQKAGAGRKGTVKEAANPREDNPVKYLVQKGRTVVRGRYGSNYNNVPDIDYDLTDKRVMWELTKKGFVQGMSTEDIEGDDFADDQL